MDSEGGRKNPPTEPRKHSNPNGATIRMNDVFKSSDTNLLGEVSLSDMNVLTSNLGESEPRNYRDFEEPKPDNGLNGGITSPVHEIPEQEDQEESQYEKS